MAGFDSIANQEPPDLPTGRVGSAVASFFGAVLGASFYLIVVRLFLLPVFGMENWIARVLSSWINLATFIAFGMSMAILFWRKWRLFREKRAFRLGLIEGDMSTLLLKDDAVELRKRLRQIDPKLQQLVLVRLFAAGLQRSRANWSAEDVGEAVKNQAELIQGQIESQYALVRYLAWAIPSIGFIGTVLGIGEALGSMNPTAAERDAGDTMERAVSYLHTAFDTTFVALVLSIVVMYFLHTVQGDEDSMLVRSTDWCMHRFVFRMHTS